MCGVGKMDFDGSYDTWESKSLEDCDYNELLIIAESDDADAPACLRWALENEFLDWDEEEDKIDSYFI